MVSKRRELKRVFRGLDAAFPGLFSYVDAPPPINGPAVGADLPGGGVVFLFVSSGDWEIMRGDVREFVPIRSVDGGEVSPVRLMAQLAHIWLINWRDDVTKMRFPPPISSVIKAFGVGSRENMFATTAHQILKTIADGAHDRAIDTIAYALAALEELDDPPQSQEEMLRRLAGK